MKNSSATATHESQSGQRPVRLPIDVGKDGVVYSLLEPLRYVKRSVSLGKEFLYDFNRFRRGSSAVNRGDSKEKLEALITMTYHSLEKGLSLPEVRPGFGVKHVDTLLLRIRTYCALYGTDRCCRTAVAALRAYQEFNATKGVAIEALDANIDELEELVNREGGHHVEGGTVDMTREKFLAAAKKDLTDFFESRNSVRQYSDESVDPEDIRRAVKLAQKSPCVCNRQSWKVRAYSDPENVRDALAIQGGAVGFNHQIPMVLVVETDLSNFQSPGERYQGWIEGGLFAMSLIYGLHSQGLVSCCLNWSKNKEVDERFKKRFSIPDSQSIAMLISVGHPRDNYRVARSWRKPLDEVVIFD